MAELSDSVRFIKGIGEKRAQLLEKLGIETLYDLVSFFPRAWQDRTARKSIAELRAGDEVCVRCVIATEPKVGGGYGAKRNTSFRAADDTGYLNIIYFNNPYVAQKLHKGDEQVFFGKVDLSRMGLQMCNPDFETVGGIVPIYHLTAGLSQKAVSKMVSAGLEACLEILPDPVPDGVRSRFELCHARYAYENIHFPEDFSALEKAKRRLVFEELYVFSAALALIKSRRVSKPGIIIERPDIEKFYSALPFSLTGAQKRSVDDALRDMAGGRPMNRLIQGDVGSGKTVCAAAAVWAVGSAGKQAALMAPTEILAEQHFKNLSGLLEPLGIRTALLKGSMTPKQKQDVVELLRRGEIDLVIGTHALISKSVEFRELALVITDEQHRFGVEQRAALSEKGENPHALVMSATPIPRTLALIIYGDLDISVIDELPPGRQKVDTFAVGEHIRERVNRFIVKQAAEGHQVYIVCPMVETGENSDSDLKSATEYASKLKKTVFPDLTVDFIHGKMKAAEKDAAMEAFRNGETDVLVATTVIEVGVDVPNATLMVIENAERFGLSQLHQLRGRVGRGKAKSHCILVSSLNEENVKKRLDVMCATNDGFKISEEDLKLRGPGDFFGSRQHGLPEMKIADLSCDLATLREAQNAAGETVKNDPALALSENSALKNRISAMFSTEIFN